MRNRLFERSATLFRNSNQKLLIEQLLLLLLFVGSANFFVFIKTTGFQDIDFSFNPDRKMDIYKVHLQMTLSSLVIGISLLIHESYVHPYLTRNLSFLKKRLIWQLDVAIIILLPIALVYFITETTEYGRDISLAARNTIRFLSSGLFLSYFIYYYLLSSLITFLNRLRKTFGQNVFYNYLTGKYGQPIEEDRVFMFVDLNDSTALAESLGHTKYSRLLNRCFEDIIQALKSYKYDIYQFVGDEIVFTWQTKDDKNGQAIGMFQAITAQLDLFKDTNYYHFGVHPTFKAAVSCGPVIGTLVGDKSKNVAYHGDVLNTAARALGLCKKYKQELLMTHFYAKKINESISSSFVQIAELKLKGKSLSTMLFGINPSKL